MRCDRILPVEITLPKGYAIRAEGRCFSALDGEGRAVGGIAIEADERAGEAVRVLAALHVEEAHRRRGLGRALCQAALQLLRREDNAAPVYLCAPAENWPAALLFAQLGFRVQKRDTFGHHVNGYAGAMATVAPLLNEAQAALIAAATSAETDFDPSALRWNEAGLIPAIAQDASSGEVLMLAWMSGESLRLTLETGYATYYSRSRRQLWRKGETSGHTQRVLRLMHDCDGDALLMQVHQPGPACHTGENTCFHNLIADGDLPATAGILGVIEATVADRAAHPRPGSYTNYLLDRGVEKICKKVGEEATETVIAAMKEDPAALAGEAADLLYHLAVLLQAKGVALNDVWEVLKKRHTYTDFQ